MLSLYLIKDLLLSGYKKILEKVIMKLVTFWGLSFGREFRVVLRFVIMFLL